LTPYEDGVPLEKLTTSTKSVADYFKDKLLAKAGKSGSATPTPFEAIKTEMDYDAPRGGLGSSRVKLEPKEDDPVDPPVRMGLSKLSSMMASSFFSASTSVLVTEDVKVEEEYVKVDTKRNSSVENDTGKRKDKKGKRRQAEDSESTRLEEVDAPTENKMTKKNDPQDKEEEEDASQTNSEAVGEDERRRVKQERKRLKALKKEQADKEKEEDALKADPVDEAERKRAKKERKRLKALKKGQAVEE
jgi:Pin2-interacting protein X1